MDPGIQVRVLGGQYGDAGTEDAAAPEGPPLTPWRFVAASGAIYFGRMATAPLPGEDLIRQGIDDLGRGITSIPALLVSVGAPRLRRLGLDLPAPIDAPEHRLYQLLRDADAATAHSRYNALIRRLVSYERAAECAS